MPESNARVLLVEDDLDVAAGILEFLARRGIEADFAANAAEAMHIARASRFDLVVLDIQLPGEDGIALCRRLRLACGEHVPMLFLTAQDALATKLRAFDAGAVDYVVKPFAPDELLARIRAQLDRAHRRDLGCSVVGDWRLDRDGHVLHHAGRHLALTALTTALLDVLMAAHPASVPRATLTEALWPRQVPDSDPLRSHLHLLRRQLLETFGRAPIVTVRGVGFRFEPED